MAGGGSPLRPGEISLAHNGVLFLDELPEFDRCVLEVLRQPLEEGRIMVARAGRTSTFPARFMLIGAMNPCPCGFRGDRDRVCRCSPAQMERYSGRISGPLLDRIDLTVEVPAIGTAARPALAEASVAIRDRVRLARVRQRERYTSSRLNAQLEGAELRTHGALDTKASALVEAAIRRFYLSSRACDRVLRVSRTIADLAGSVRIDSTHVAEALQYRLRQPSSDFRQL